MPGGGSDAGVAIDVAVEHLVFAQRVLHKRWFVSGTGAQRRRSSVENGPRSRRSASGVCHCVHRLQLARGFGIADRPGGVSSRSQSRSSAGRRRASCREQLHRWFSSLYGQRSAKQSSMLFCPILVTLSLICGPPLSLRRNLRFVVNHARPSSAPHSKETVPMHMLF
jgi:hypothetical protein